MIEPLQQDELVSVYHSKTPKKGPKLLVTTMAALASICRAVWSQVAPGV